MDIASRLPNEAGYNKTSFTGGYFATNMVEIAVALACVWAFWYKAQLFSARAIVSRRFPDDTPTVGNEFFICSIQLNRG